jgi:lysozyme family protein
MDVSSLPYSPRFNIALGFTLDWECVFAHGHYGDPNHVIAEHDPNDPGGTTKFGIDAGSHPGVDVENLDLAGAAHIYHDGFRNSEGIIYAGGEWSLCNCELMPDRWAMAVFDLAVNPGRVDELWVQKLLEDHVDGKIGPETIASINAAGDDKLAALLNRRDQYYRGLASEHPRFREFLGGWLDRNAALRKALHL